MKIKKILPSKKFIIVISIAAAIVLAALIGSSYFGSKKSFQSTKEMSVDPNAVSTVGDVIRLDSNSNGIPDWEETLWGLDPKGNGAANKKIIDDKEAASASPSAGPASDAPLTETQKFSQELLTSVVALRASGSLTPDILATLGNSLDVDLAARRTNTPTYTSNDMKVLTTEDAAVYQTYRSQFKRIILRYEQDGKMGSEMDIIAAGLDDNAPDDSLNALEPIGQAYINFGKEIMALQTPSDAVPTSLALANISDHAGHALLKLKTLYTDAMTGVIGLDEYVNDTDPFNQASQDVISYFSSKDANP